MAAKKTKADNIQELQTQLNEKFPPEKIYSREGKAGMSYDYVPAPEVVNRLNDIFGVRWSFEEKESYILDGFYVKRVRLYVGDPDDPSRLWFREGMGSHRIYKGSDPGDAAKSAQSKALTKAASYFGVALHLWGVDTEQKEQVETPPVQDTQPNPQMVVVNPGQHNSVPPGAQTVSTPPPPPSQTTQPGMGNNPTPPPPPPLPGTQGQQDYQPSQQAGGAPPPPPGPMMRNPNAPMFKPPQQTGGTPPPPKPVPYPTLNNTNVGQTSGPGTQATTEIGLQAQAPPNMQPQGQGMIVPAQLNAIMGKLFQRGPTAGQREDPVTLVKQALNGEVDHIQTLNELTFDQAQRAIEILS